MEDTKLETTTPQKPNEVPTEVENVCRPDDKECLARLISAFSDCD